MEKLTRVAFNPEGDGITALYMGDRLHMSGDYYHDKIDDKIEGFLNGVKLFDPTIEVDHLYVTAEDNEDIELMSYALPTLKNVHSNFKVTRDYS